MFLGRLDRYELRRRGGPSRTTPGDCFTSGPIPMPSVSENLRIWADGWDWGQGGDEWSWWWGGTPAQWHGALLPRIHAFVPTARILEIGPGYGRWTQYLKDLADELVLVDLTPECIASCRERFSDSDRIRYHVNDGRSLAVVDDGSIDFVFSFDSLVHATPEVIDGYLAQLSHKLSPDGVGFIHHSNVGALAWLGRLSHRLPKRLLGPLMRHGLAINIAAWRDERMSAREFRDQCDRAGLSCVSQETVSWEFG